MTQNTTPNASQEQVAEDSINENSVAEQTALDENGQAVGDTEQFEEQAASVEETIQQLQTELTEAQAKADEYLDRLQRTAAEFQNSRRRQEKQLATEIERANGDLIKRLLPVLDDLDLAFQNVPAELQSTAAQNGAAEQPQAAWLDGFRQIHKKLLDILTEQGLALIDSTGEFDPMRHEAISSEPNEDVKSGHIIATLRAGYEYKGRVLRPALVRIAA